MLANTTECARGGLPRFARRPEHARSVAIHAEHFQGDSKLKDRTDRKRIFLCVFYGRAARVRSFAVNKRRPATTQADVIKSSLRLGGFA